MSVLNTIRNTLERLAERSDVPMSGVWYGACQAEKEKLNDWNYFVFNRMKTAKSSNKVDFQTFYQVHIIHEDFIPEGYIETVIKDLETQNNGEKLRCTSDDIEYRYTFKGNTNTVVEIATITVFHPEKRC